ncbi:ankyrin repeat domain-containing protein 16-like isoform X2 [Oratosquilla oratoria]|uniref:ankyrin repeat domain-containing protein 16-like isoform X2 n=1 Tax=Oratosquilla oratoria TaxID=337810 RepID=UPI003F770DB3
MLQQDILHWVQRGEEHKLADVEGQSMDWKKCVHTKSGDTVLHIVARTGNKQIFNVLISKGASNCIEQQNQDGKRPLHEAAQAGSLDVVDGLLEQGATLDPLKRGDWTPLMLACTKDDLRVIERLTKEGAKLDLQNKDGWTSFHVACREGFRHIITFLLDIFPNAWNTVSKNGRTPLHTAAMHGHTEIVQMVLRCGHPTNTRDSCGNTPLLDALRMGHLDVAEVLLSSDEGASILEHVDVMGRNVLHIVAEAGCTTAVKYLVEKWSMDVHTTSKNGMTALHWAAKEGQQETLHLLISVGSEVNKQDDKGRTALWLASCGRKHLCAEELRAKGAQEVADHAGVSPCQLLPPSS